MSPRPRVPPPPIPSPPPSLTLPPCPPTRPRPRSSSLRRQGNRRLPPSTAAVTQRRKVWVQGLPCLVSLCRFWAILHPGRRPTFGPRAARYGLFPFFGLFNAPQMGPRPCIQPVPGRYGFSPFVDLSVAPQSQAGSRFPKHGPPEKTRSTIQDKSIAARSRHRRGALPSFLPAHACALRSTRPSCMLVPTPGSHERRHTECATA